MMTKKKQADTWKARITIVEGYAQVETRQPGDGVVSKPVALDSLAQALSGIPMSSGILPHDTLFYSMMGATALLGVYVPPAVHTLQTPTRSYQVPLPGLVFAGHGRTYALYALASKEWPTGDAQLYYPPLPNIFNSGAICQGEMIFPDCTPESIWTVWQEYVIGSYFTGHMQSDRVLSKKQNIFDVWERLEQEQADQFPVAELVLFSPRKTLAQLAAGKGA